MRIRSALRAEHKDNRKITMPDQNKTALKLIKTWLFQWNGNFYEIAKIRQGQKRVCGLRW